MGIIRKTQAADVLLDEFKKDSNAISAIELIKRLANKVNKTTVYRLLDKLEDDGVLHYFLDSKALNGLQSAWGVQSLNTEIYIHIFNVLTAVVLIV